MSFVALLVMLQRRGDKVTAPVRRFATKGADKFVAEGRIEEAGRLAMISNNWEEAIDLYRMAHKPDLAAAAARRAGQLLVAADLYDQAGDTESAAICRNAHNTLSSFPPAAPMPAAPSALATPTPVLDIADAIPSHVATSLTATEADSRQVAAAQVAAPPNPLAPAIPKAPAMPSLELDFPRSAPSPIASEPPFALPVMPSGPPEQNPVIQQAGSIPPHPSFGSKPPEKSSYSFISEPPARRRSSAPPQKDSAPPQKNSAPPRQDSAPPGKHSSPPRRGGAARRVSAPPRARRSTQPIGTRSVAPLIGESEVEALVAELVAVVSTPERRSLRELAAAAGDGDRRLLRQRWYGSVGKAVGLESQSVDLRLLHDDAVRAAITAEGIDSLLAFIGDQPCDLANIEVFHRLGLAHLAHGRWDEALRAFHAVTETSPGYRDADERVDALRTWHEALGARRLGLGADEPYVLLGELGRGANAVVYRAHDRDRDAEIALKVFATTVRDQAMGARLQEAARAAEALNHPSIARVYAHGDVDGNPWLSMDIVEGLPIHVVHEALTIVETLETLVTVLDTLAYAHEAEVLHGDLRPANIIMRPAGGVVLTDFAVNHALHPQGAGGAIGFLAPEQIRGDREDHRTDVFMAGVTAYVLLSGRLPFEGSDRSGDVAPLTDVPHMPQVVDEAIRKALAAEPVSRWPSAKAFARPLRTVLEAVKKHTTG